MVRKTEINAIIRMGAERKMLGILNSQNTSFNDLVSQSGYSRSYINNLLKKLKNENKVEETIDIHGKKVWKSTKKGYSSYNNSWTALSEDLSDIIIKGGSYMRHSDQPSWPEQYLLSTPPIVLDNATYPSNLENIINPIQIQYRLNKLLIKELLNSINSRKVIPQDSKLILAYEVDLFAYSEFITKVKTFIEDIKIGEDVFTDTRLGLDSQEFNKLALFEAYLNNSDLFLDQTYNVKLEKLFKNKTFISLLMSFGLWHDLLDQKTLAKIIKMFKSREDPLSDKKLIKKLIVKTPDGLGFYVPLYDYITIARILNHNDEKLKNKLLEYELENRYRPDKSLIFKIQEKMRGKRK